MQDKTNISLFRRLNRLFKNGAHLRKKIKSRDTTIVVPDNAMSSGMLLFQKSSLPSYSAVTTSAYNLSERMMRYQDAQEMESCAEISAALDIVSDETVSQDERGRILHVYSENEKIKELLDDLYFNILNVDFNLKPWVRNLLKYGDSFLYNDVSPQYGVMNVIPIPVNEIEREENYDRNDPFAVRFRWNSLGNRILENWEVSHFRLMGNDMYAPYGASIIEPARRIWRQLVLLEDAMLVYRLVRAPERRVFYIDVGNLPADEVEGYIEKQKQQLRTQQVMTNTGGSDLRYNALPIHKDSPIPLLDGRTITIEQLANEFNDGKENWVYSISDSTQELLPGKVVWCGKNYSAKKLVKILLDDNSYILAAPEHPFILRDGTSKQAQDLVVDESLMPLYKRVSSKGYEEVYDPKLGKYIFTHRFVASNVYVDDWNNKHYHCVHHKNPGVDLNNKRNNTPQNLQVMDYWEHRKWHQDQIKLTLLTPENLEKNRQRLIAYNKTPEHSIRTIARNKKLGLAYKMSAMYNHSELHKQHNVTRRNKMQAHWIQNRQKHCAALKWQFSDYTFQILFETLKNNLSIGRYQITQLLLQNELFVNQFAIDNVNKTRTINKLSHCAWLAEFSRRGFGKTLTEVKQNIQSNFQYKNHKIISTQVIDVDGEDVYCMTVVGPNNEQDRHNFAVYGIDDLTKLPVQNGVFVKNSIEEDMFIPIRSSDTGTKIDTLPGGQNAAAIEDVEYLQKKLIASLKIPRAYLGYEDSLSCLTGQSKIPLLDNRTLSIEELSNLDWSTDNDIWVYSCDQTTGEFKPGRVIKAWKTKEVDQLYRITLDNGHIIECTENHPFLCRDGEYCRADQLKIGQSLMAQYRKLSQSKKYGGEDLLDKYEMLLSNANNEWKYTHKLVDESECMRTIGKQRVIHHIDCNKANNKPTNLMEMDWYSHRKYHANNLESTLFRPDVVLKTRAAVLEWTKSQKHRDFKSKMMREATTTPGNIHYERIHSQQHKDKMSEVMQQNWKNESYRALKIKQNKELWNDESYRAEHSGENHWLSKQHKDYDIDWLRQFCVQHNVTTVRQFRGDYKNSIANISPVGIRYVYKLIFNNGYKTWAEFKQTVQYNHKVAMIEIVKLEQSVPVYDIEVEKWHNFLVVPNSSTQQDNLWDSGVYIHNSKATLSQEDVRFSRTINSIQKTITAELNKLAVIHLFAHGFADDDLMNFTLHLTNPSTIAEQQKLELWRTRFEIIDGAPRDLVSNRWLSKNVLNFTDAEIRTLQAEQEEEGGAGEASEGGGGGGGLFGGGGGTDELSGDEEVSGEEGELLPGLEDMGDLIPDEEEEKPEEELNAGMDREDDDLLVAANDHKNRHQPIKPVSRAIQQSKHRRYVRHKKSGHADVGMSNMMKHLEYDKNPFSGDPFSEGVVQKRTALAAAPDMRAMLTKMSKKQFGIYNQQSKSILTEEMVDVQAEIDETNTDLKFEQLFLIDDESDSNTTK